MTLQLRSVEELTSRLAAERAGVPFLLYRDEHERQRIAPLDGNAGEMPVGRRPDRGVQLEWDPEVSRVHALLVRVGGAWTVVDDGISRNGTFLNGERVLGRRRLSDGDVLRCGSVALEFRDPDTPAGLETRAAPEEASAQAISPAQRRVLVALCAPLGQAPYAPPATNKEIGSALSLSVDAVKAHLRRLCDLLGVDDLPQNQKRAQLAWKALSAGLVSPRELANHEAAAER